MTVSTLPTGVAVIRGQQLGPRIGVMAIVHGDEPAGLAALDFLATYFAKTPLAAGELWLIRGNPEALRLGRRGVDTDMNRLFLPDDAPGLRAVNRLSADYHRSRELMPVLAQLNYLLDLHNTTRPSPPFSLSMSETPEHKRLAMALPVEFAAFGFQGTIEGTTSCWVNRYGGIAVSVECGYQHDPNVGTVAVACVKSFLGMLGVSGFEAHVTSISRQLAICGHELIADKASFNYTREYNNLDPLAPGELIARDAVREYRAPERTGLVIVFPVSIKSARDGSNASAYSLGTFLETETPQASVVHE